MNKRKSGILLHITSLPGKEGIGTLGAEAVKFVDFLKETGQKIWQILPLGPVGYRNSPYQCYSAFAGNPLLIDLKVLSEEGLIPNEDLAAVPRFPAKEVNFDKVERWKMPLLRNAFQVFRDRNFDRYRDEYGRFLDEHNWWLGDYALFMAAKQHFNNDDWHLLPRAIKFREEAGLNALKQELAEEIEFRKFLQFVFFRQWHGLKAYANENGVEILGDVPLYVSGDSADVWANTDIFVLDENLQPTEVGGVPPDYFSETGQLWGNPVFDWERLQKRGYDWWAARLHFNLRMFNLVRIDHFRGLESFWSVPAGEQTAINGEWIPAHGHNLLSLIKSHLGKLLFIAEDLGIITPEVDKLREDFGLPGMKVLQFAFTTDAENKDLPHNYGKNFVVYTGTHDNNTTLGWLNALEGEEKRCVKQYLKGEGKEALAELLEMALASVARTAVVPMQDVLELGEEARMNTPGIPSGNWAWRFRWSDLKTHQKGLLKSLTGKYNR
ncbi:4-alpha-glucanotransferase [Maribellus sp. CM-23]|uniref:4-alpha-glucanotransferase n=1 Tax=Maribellus sp. CM-23 TaxID=2781026 RepID=UPI001F2C7AC7|nr:4-alpha-glucanotransferase [Maribellus sp. CM-23]MCE4564168.1 4-alpha-glucanotransferase [Maribellus sp. CM-23]